MSGEIEAAGALATAGAIAGAIEKGDPGRSGEGACLNCGTELGGGRYCSNCGQSARPHRTLVSFVSELLSSMWQLDTKAWRTLPKLFFRPGTLTREYVHGKRARFFSPLAMFLLAIFFLFFAFSFAEAPVGVGGTPAEQRAAVAVELAEARRDLAEAEAELPRERAQPPDPNTGDLDARLAQQGVTIQQGVVQRLEGRVAAIDQRIASQVGDGDGEGIVTARAEIDGFGWAPGETWQDGARRLAASENFRVSDNPEINERARQSLANPDLMVYRIQEAASKFAFLLAPLSLPFVALLFLWKRGVTLYDHMAYALYALAFAAFLFSAVIGAMNVPWLAWLAPILFWIGLPAHMFFHLKGAYALGWFSALWRTVFMLIFASIVAAIFLSIVIILGLVG